MTIRPEITYIVKDKQWELCDPFPFKGYGLDITIHAGYRFDLASIPRLFWREISPFELGIVPPLVHDYLYEKGGRIKQNNGLSAKFSKLEADNIFLALMKREGVSWWKRSVAYRAVRWFGNGSFNEE